MRSIFLLLALALFSALAASPMAAQEDDEDRPLPGLLATYRVAGKEEAVVTRYESLPAMLLAAAEGPDPRLPAKGWTADWQGTIEILRPGKYRFAGRSSGLLEIRIDDVGVLKAAGGKDEVVGEQIPLKFGLH